MYSSASKLIAGNVVGHVRGVARCGSAVPASDGFVQLARKRDHIGIAQVRESEARGRSRALKVRFLLEDDERPLVNILRSLPVHVPLRTPDGTPKWARKRMGRLGRILLEELLAAVSAQASDAVLEEKVWSLQHLYAAILYQRTRREAAESFQEDSRTSNDQWKQVR